MSALTGFRYGSIFFSKELFVYLEECQREGETMGGGEAERGKGERGREENLSSNRSFPKCQQ